MTRNCHRLVRELQQCSSRVRAMSERAVQLFRRIDAVEHRWCLHLNRSSRRPAVRRLFAIVSRLGDGVFWYLLALLLPVVYGEAGVGPALRMAVVGGVGLAIYKY